MSQAKLKGNDLTKILVRLPKEDAEFLKKMSFMYNQSVNKTMLDLIKNFKNNLQSTKNMLA